MAMVLLRQAVQCRRAERPVSVGSKKNFARGKDGLLERYDVTNRVEHDEEADDESGSRAYPSRTSIGQRWEIAQKAGIDTGPLKLFGIPISNMLYYVNWKLTNAQLELIAADVSVVDYNYGDKKKKRKKKGEFDDTKANKADVRNAAEQWRKRYENADSAGIELGDVFAGSLT